MSDTQNFNTLVNDFDFGVVGQYNRSGDGTQYELVPEGPYVLELVGKGEDEPVAKEWNPTGKKMRARFTFKVVDDPDYEGKTVSDFFTISLHEKAPLYGVVKALLGGKVPADVRITKELLIGKRMQAMVEHRQSKSNPDRSYAKINAPTPVRQRKGDASTEAGPPPF